jgi:hypothetical protein
VYGVHALSPQASESESFRLRHLAGPGIDLHDRRRTATSGASVTTSAETLVPPAEAMQAYHNLVYFNEVDEGNHFAASGQPDLFTSEVRAGFRSLREGRSL